MGVKPHLAKGGENQHLLLLSSPMCRLRGMDGFWIALFVALVLIFLAELVRP